MSDQEDKKSEFPSEIIPVLAEVSPSSFSTSSFSSSSIANALFSEETQAQALIKVSALEAFLELMLKDMKFNDFAQELLTVFIKVIHCEAASVFELDAANQSLFFRAAVGVSSDRLSSFSVPIGKGIVGHVAEKLAPLNVENTEQSRTHLKSIESAVGFKTRNLIAVPILVRGKLYGVLEMLNRVGEPNFSSADLDLATYLCEMASRILEVRFMIAWLHSQPAISLKEAA